MSEHQARAQMLDEIAQQRIVILDGAMGTMIQQLGLTEQDFRGDLLAEHNRDLKGNNDLLSLTRPAAIRAIHDAFLEAGADIVTTNTFNATALSQADYGTENLVRDMNIAAAHVAVEAAQAAATLGRPRFAAGALGPTSKTASISPDVGDPGYRAVTFDDLRAGYLQAAAGLIEGGVDLLVLETVFDTLNAKAAIFALEELFAELGFCLPLILSGTVTDLSGPPSPGRPRKPSGTRCAMRVRSRSASIVHSGRRICAPMWPSYRALPIRGSRPTQMLVCPMSLANMTKRPSKPRLS